LFPIIVYKQFYYVKISIQSSTVGCWSGTGTTKFFHSSSYNGEHDHHWSQNHTVPVNNGASFADTPQFQTE